MGDLPVRDDDDCGAQMTWTRLFVEEFRRNEEFITNALKVQCVWVEIFWDSYNWHGNGD